VRGINGLGVGRDRGQDGDCSDNTLHAVSYERERRQKIGKRESKAVPRPFPVGFEGAQEAGPPLIFKGPIFFGVTLYHGHINFFELPGGNQKGVDC
jgi:hypothetical protein